MLRFFSPSYQRLKSQVDHNDLFNGNLKHGSSALPKRLKPKHIPVLMKPHMLPSPQSEGVNETNQQIDI